MYDDEINYKLSLILLHIYIYIFKKLIVFDVERFYPSIDKTLLEKALKWCKKYVELTDEEIDVIMAARKAILYMYGEPRAKKGGDIFDVGMGFFDGEEVCELCGLFLLDEIKKEININLGTYRNDALGVTDLPPQGADRLKKKIAAIF